MGVDVPQDGHRLHPISVPDTDEWVFSYLTGGHLDLVWMDGQTETQTGEKGISPKLQLPVYKFQQQKKFMF